MNNVLRFTLIVTGLWISIGVACAQNYGNNLWAQQQQLRSPNIETSAFFGAEIAMHPDGSVFVAAKEEDSVFANEGVVYIFAPPSDLLLRDGLE